MDYHKELSHAAAVAVAAMESLERNRNALPDLTVLQQENARLEKELQGRIDRMNIPAVNALDCLWREVILKRKPDYGPWEYPGQAYRHIMAEIEEIKREVRVEFQRDDLTRKLTERDREIEGLRRTADNDDARLREAASRAGITYWGCDTPDALADEVSRLRTEVERLRGEAFTIIGSLLGHIETMKADLRRMGSTESTPASVVRARGFYLDNRPSLSAPAGQEQKGEIRPEAKTGASPCDGCRTIRKTPGL